MDFFQHQDAARRRSGLLVALFALAVACIVVATCIVVGAIVALHAVGTGPTDASLARRVAMIDWRVFAVTAGATLAVVGGASLYKLTELRAGGRIIAERLGGRLISHDADDAAERRALNVVEEMAVASGVPVPPVYIMDDERAINAFAAGYAPADAVIGLTRGCVERLSRDELQGVVAHEFSHLLNGDMRRNIRLIGLLHGVLAIGLVGELLLRSLRYGSMRRARRSSSDKGGGVLAILALGLALVALGAVGAFFGGLIKAAVSRQREYLADASAVQFTRNPGGISGALKRIGGMSRRGRLTSPNAQIASHMYFADGVGLHLASLFATHPPLDRRIRRIEPNWDGRFPAPARAHGNGDGATHEAPGAGAVAGLAQVRESIAHVGRPTPEHAAAASALLGATPAPLLRAAHDLFGAQALVCAALIDRRRPLRDEQLRLIEREAPRGLAHEADRLADELATLDPALRLPLLDVALGSLRALTPAQRERMRLLAERLIGADRRITLFEWCLRRMLMRSLDEAPPPRVTHYGPQRLGGPISVVLSVLAAVGGRDEEGAQRAFAGAAGALPVALRFAGPEERSLRALEAALDRLAGLAPRHKRALLEACAACIAADGEARIEEVETLRAIADALGCPMPPLLAPL